MYPIAGMWVFWIPLAILGFPPKQIVAIVLINLAFQFFVHTQVIGKLGWLEYVLNTPSIHRVHHARNDRYIDRNYAGVLVIWDRLFGSFVEEDPHDAPVYGIVEPLHTFNPLKATFHEWASMSADVRRVQGWRNKLSALFGPPAWAAAYHASLGDTQSQASRKDDADGARPGTANASGNAALHAVTPADALDNPASASNPATFQAPRTPGKFL
jgi:hypothetical protein